MSDFAQWSLDAIRSEDGMLSWLEESRFDWASTTALALEQILNGRTIILVTDQKRKWFEKYILDNINSNPSRPLLPIVSIDSVYPHYNEMQNTQQIEFVEDMIMLSYKHDYLFWYIGRGDDKRADMPKRKDNSYFWIFDEEFYNAFKLNSYDNYLDIKLLQLYKLFDLSLDAAMFGEVDVAS
jgi:hypothetical protein